MGEFLDKKSERRVPIERGAAPPSGGLGGSFFGRLSFWCPSPSRHARAYNCRHAGDLFRGFFLSSRAEHNQNPPTDTANRHCALVSTRRKIAVSPASPPELRAFWLLAAGRSRACGHGRCCCLVISPHMTAQDHAGHAKCAPRHPQPRAQRAIVVLVLGDPKFTLTQKPSSPRSTPRSRAAGDTYQTRTTNNPACFCGRREKGFRAGVRAGNWAI